MFSIIAAIGKNRELGKGGDLVFHLKDDMKFFRETTTGHKVVMGRKTWESLPRKLPERENIVISSQELEGPDLIVHNPDELIAEFKNSEEEVFIIGGASIYALFLPYAQKIYLTEVGATVSDADVFFPSFDKSKYKKILIKRGVEDGLEFAISLYALDAGDGELAG